MKLLKQDPLDLFKNTRSLFRSENELENKLKLSNARFGFVPKSTPKFGVSFETPVLKQSFFEDGGKGWPLQSAILRASGM